MDDVARYNIQKGGPITPLMRANADYSNSGSALDNWILHHQEMKEKFLAKAEYEKFIKAAAADIEKELEKLLKDFNR